MKDEVDKNPYNSKSCPRFFPRFFISNLYLNSIASKMLHLLPL